MEQLSSTGWSSPSTEQLRLNVDELNAARGRQGEAPVPVSVAPCWGQVSCLGELRFAPGAACTGRAQYPVDWAARALLHRDYNLCVLCGALFPERSASQFTGQVRVHLRLGLISSPLPSHSHQLSWNWSPAWGSSARPLSLQTCSPRQANLRAGAKGSPRKPPPQAVICPGRSSRQMRASPSSPDNPGTPDRAHACARTVPEPRRPFWGRCREPAQPHPAALSRA